MSPTSPNLQAWPPLSLPLLKLTEESAPSSEKGKSPWIFNELRSGQKPQWLWTGQKEPDYQALSLPQHCFVPTQG